LAYDNYFHLDAYISYEQTFQVILSNVGSMIPSPSLRVDMFITLTVTSPEGLNGYDYIFVTMAGETWFSNNAPVPAFSVSENTYPLQYITFDASQSKDSDGDSIFYAWDFGDGMPQNVFTFNPYIYNPGLITHAYQNTGTYNVTLTAMDNYLASSVISQMVYIGNFPPIGNTESQPVTTITNSTLTTPVSPNSIPSKAIPIASDRNSLGYNNRHNYFDIIILTLILIISIVF